MFFLFCGLLSCSNASRSKWKGTWTCMAYPSGWVNTHCLMMIICAHVHLPCGFRGPDANVRAMDQGEGQNKWESLLISIQTGGSLITISRTCRSYHARLVRDVVVILMKHT